MVEADEGITATSPEAIAALKPVNDWGVHSYAAQTHPADGNATIAVCTREKAKELADDGPEIQIVSFGYARAPKARMGAAPVPATEMALAKAGLKASDIKVWKTHSPFAVNDVNMAKKFGVDPYKDYNDFGCSLIYGHPMLPPWHVISSSSSSSWSCKVEDTGSHSVAPPEIPGPR